jgi:DNA-binding transcriptional LysR family regulator
VVNLHHLRIFYMLATTGSFTGAARRLGISQPAVTIQVRELEAASGARLIERRARRLVLTDAGKALLAVTEKIFALVDEAEGVLARAGRGVAGTLTIAASGTAGAYHLPRLLTAFRRRYPGVRVVLEISNSRRVLDQVLGFEADLGVLGAPDGAAPAAVADDPRLLAHPFVRDPLVVALPPRHAWAGRRSVGLSELAREPLVLREPGSATRRLLEAHLEACGLVPRVVMELGSNEAIKHAVEAGVALAVVGGRAIAREVADGRLAAVRLRPAGLALRFFLVHHKERGHAAVLRAFLALARVPRR